MFGLPKPPPGALPGGGEDTKEDGTMIQWTDHSAVKFGQETLASAGGRSRLVFCVQKCREPMSRCYEFKCYELRDANLGGQVLRHIGTGFDSVESAKRGALAEVASLRKAVQS